MFPLVVDLYLSDIGCLYREKLQHHARCRILGMSMHGVSTIFSFKSWVIYFPIGCRHPFIKYWQPLLAQTTATCSLPHPENECQQVQLWHIWVSRHRADLRVHNGIIVHCDSQKCNESTTKYRFQINRYCKLQSMQKHILGC